MLKLYHPICHFINGERLYFLLIQTKANVFDKKGFVNECVEGQGLSACYCGYVILGSTDILLQIWAEEKELAGLLHDLRSDREKVSKVVSYMIDTMSTWYQTKLEKRAGFWGLFSKDSYRSLMKHDVPGDLIYQEPKAQTRDHTRYFVFLEEPYATHSVLFPQLREILQEQGGQEHVEYFREIKHTSVFAYQAETHRGVVIRGKASCLDRIADSINRLAQKFNVRTTTHICCEKLVEETDEIRNRRRTGGIKVYEKRVLYNLFKSHDCYRRRFEGIGDANEINDRFLDLCKPLIGCIFAYNESWWRTIETLRKLYRWVVFQKNEPLIGFLMRRYIFFETFLRENLRGYLGLVDLGGDVKGGLVRAQRAIDKLKKITNDDGRDGDKDMMGAIRDLEAAVGTKLHTKVRDEERITWGSIRECMGKLKRHAGLAKNDGRAISELGDTINSCAKDRNNLMHGNVSNLFREEDERGEALWETYVTNMIRLCVLIEYHRGAFQEFVQNLSDKVNRQQRA